MNEINLDLLLVDGLYTTGKQNYQYSWLTLK